MVGIPDLVRRKAAFDPETIAVLSAALDEAWDRLINLGANAPGPPTPALCARSNLWVRAGP